MLGDRAAGRVLIAHFTISGLDVFSPGPPKTSGTRSAITTAGTMTLLIGLIDSVTGDDDVTSCFTGPGRSK
ncbi:MAG: hypothetical protein WBS20_15835 [Lysobacterales bacterium]